MKIIVNILSDLKTIFHNYNVILLTFPVILKWRKKFRHFIAKTNKTEYLLFNTVLEFATFLDGKYHSSGKTKVLMNKT